MIQGQVRLRPPQDSSQANPRVHPLSPLTVVQPFEPLPVPLGQPPYHFDLENVLPGITAHAAKLGHLVFHCVGDTGGVSTSTFQTAVAAQMETDLALPVSKRPQFFYHLGDVVYFNGQVSEYFAQFYDPYAHYTAPILGIPGNHDGDPIDATQTSLDGWVRYFMTPKPIVQPESGDAPRVTLSLPNVYFTLVAPFVTIVGMYTNVPDGGSIDSQQQQWLTNELATAPTDKALILALHHPIYSFDQYHSGSPAMAAVVEQAINDSRRVPNMVLTGHVHDYQRIERTLVATAPTPFLVAGLGGYHNLHAVKTVVGFVDSATGARLVAVNSTDYGYMTLRVTKTEITGSVTPVLSKTASIPRPVPTDPFKYSAKPIHLPAGVSITL